MTETAEDPKALKRVGAELIAREPIFHKPELGTSRDDWTDGVGEDTRQQRHSDPADDHGATAGHAPAGKDAQRSRSTGVGFGQAGTSPDWPSKRNGRNTSVLVCQSRDRP